MKKTKIKLVPTITIVVLFGAFIGFVAHLIGQYIPQNKPEINLIQTAATYHTRDIQEKIDRLPPTGGTITLEAGEYLLDKPSGTLEYYPDGTPIQTAILISKDNIILQGNPSGTILKLAPHTKMRIISISSKNVVIKNMTLDGNKDQRNGSVPWPGGDLVDGLLYGDSHSKNLLFENLEIRNGVEDAMGCWKCTNLTSRNNYLHDNGTAIAGGAGLSFSGTKNGIAQNNRVENNTATGIWASFDANNIKITNNQIKNNASGGITIGGGDVNNGLGANNTGFEISNNTLANNGTAKFATITIFASKNGIIANNKIESSPYDSFQIGGTVQYPTSKWTLSNNICGPNTKINNLGNSSAITLENNMCLTNYKLISIP